MRHYLIRTLSNTNWHRADPLALQIQSDGSITHNGQLVIELHLPA